MALDAVPHGPEQAKLGKAVGEFDTYLRANAERIPNYGAGVFDGKVFVKEDVTCPGDMAEDFDVADGETIPAGSLVSVGAEGALRLAAVPYDTVVGIISRATGFRPAFRLNHVSSDRVRLPVALTGKVMRTVDASSSPIKAGDLLTSSSTPGHAMCATDTSRRSGAVIGKALRPLARGRGLIPVIAVLH